MHTHALERATHSKVFKCSQQLIIRKKKLEVMPADLKHLPERQLALNLE